MSKVNFPKRLIMFIFTIFCILLMTSCFGSESEKKGETIDPNGNTLSEDILYEDILTEINLTEYKSKLVDVVENKLEEDCISEDIKVEVFLADDIDGLFDSYFVDTSDAFLYDINWPEVIGKFAVGTAVIVVTGVVSVITSKVPGVGYIFASSCKGALRESVIGASIGATLNSAIASIKTGGNLDAVKKYAIEGAADGFMWGAISGAVLGSISSSYDYYGNSRKIFDGNKLIGTIDDDNRIINNGSIIGKIESETNSTGDKIVYYTSKVDVKNKRIIGDIPDDGLYKMNGYLDDNGNLVSGWRKIFSSERRKGVNQAWKEEKELVQATGRGTRDWTIDELTELLKNGKVSGYEGHHINSAMYSPQLANKPNNIIFYSSAEHLSIGHGGSYQTITFGNLLDRSII